MSFPPTSSKVAFRYSGQHFEKKTAHYNNKIIFLNKIYNVDIVYFVQEYDFVVVVCCFLSKMLSGESNFEFWRISWLLAKLSHFALVF